MSSRTFTWNSPTGLVALIAAVLCLLPTTGFLLAWQQFVDLATYTRFVTLPAVVLLAVCEWFLVRRSPLLFNRLAAGLVGGVVATLVFDLVRYPATFAMHGAPDFVPMIGQYLTHEMIGIAPSPVALVVGYAYHYMLDGALLGAAYSLTFGRGHWSWALGFAAIAAIAFDSLPQAQLLVTATGYGLVSALATWAAAFLAAGAVLGVLVRRWSATRANVLSVVFLRQHPTEVPEALLR